MRIQSFADLLICRQDWSVQAYSTSLSDLVSDSDRLQVGADLAAVLSRQFAHDARGWGQSMAVTAQVSRAFGYQIADRRLDVSCHGASESYCIVLEPSAPGRPFAPDALTRRLLQRVRRLAGRQQALDAAMKALRLSLRADSVSLLRALPGHRIVLEAQDSKSSYGSWPPNILPVMHAEIFSDAGIISDSHDAGCLLVGGAELKSGTTPSWLRIPSPLMVSFLGERGSNSAHWYVAASTRGEEFCLFVEHNAAGAVDAVKRHATELALEVLLLIIDAEHPSTDY